MYSNYSRKLTQALIQADDDATDIRQLACGSLPAGAPELYTAQAGTAATAWSARTQPSARSASDAVRDIGDDSSNEGLELTSRSQVASSESTKKSKPNISKHALDIFNC